MTRLQIAQNFLSDAGNHKLSPMSRENCAFSAGYLFALEAIPSSFTGKLEHPSPLVIRTAARYLSLDMAAMEPALVFIREQYSSVNDGRNVQALLAWALVMKKGSQQMSAKNKSLEDPAAQDEQIPQVFAKISDPSNAYLFTADAARKAFKKVVLPSQDEEDELIQVRKQLDAAIRVMQQHEARRSKMLRGLALGGLIAFVLVVLAIVFMR